MIISISKTESKNSYLYTRSISTSKVDKFLYISHCLEDKVFRLKKVSIFSISCFPLFLQLFVYKHMDDGLRFDTFHSYSCCWRVIYVIPNRAFWFAFYLLKLNVIQYFGQLQRDLFPFVQKRQFQSVPCSVE